MVKIKGNSMKKRICKTCGKVFKPSSGHLNCWKCRHEKSKIECPKCGKKMQRKSKICHSCRMRLLIGKDNPNWKGGKTNHNGYKMIHCVDHPRVTGKTSKYIMEHILVMEEYLRRCLVEDEHVHHKNGIKNDNRIENLELWTTNHPTGCRVEDLSKWAYKIIEKYGAV